MIAARELDDPIAASEAAGKADRAHRRLGARARRAAPSRRTARRRRSPRRARPPARSARRTSSRRRPPPARRATISGSAWPKISGPHDMHPVDVAIARRRPRSYGALATADEERRVEADRPHRAHGRVHAARDERPRFAESSELRGSRRSEPFGRLPGPVRDDHVRARALDRSQTSRARPAARRASP